MATGNASPFPRIERSREFEALSDADKERVWRSYAREVIPESEFREATPAERRQFNADRRRDRPPAGREATRINVTIERVLLKQADAFAEANDLTRAALIARGLRLALTETSDDYGQPSR